MQRSNRWILMLLIIASIQLVSCGQASITADKIDPAHVEAVEGTDLKRVILTERAAERIDVQTMPVIEEQVVRTRRVGAQIVAAESKAVASSTLTAPNSSDVLVRISLSASGMNTVDRSQPALVTPLDGDTTATFTALPVEVLSTARDASEDEALYYAIEGESKGLTSGQRVMVELTLQGSGAQQKIVPYAAVIYDTSGGAWVYTRPEPFVFVRAPITVDYIEGDRAVLLDGPLTGTNVVTVGGSLLYGAETGVSK